MSCHQIPNGIICLSGIEFLCPHCEKKYIDSDDKYYKRIDKNKSAMTRIKCSCGKKFGMTTDYKSNMVGFKL